MCLTRWTGFDVEAHLAQTPLRDHKDLGMLSHTHIRLPLPETHSSGDQCALCLSGHFSWGKLGDAVGQSSG